ncbi:MAG: MmcQ/YjbR family DNA-binding protein [Bradymonadaceae bacterium]
MAIELEDIREYCLAKPGVTEDFPFDEDTLVFRVVNKLFLLTNLERHPPAINLKCDPELAMELRERYAAVLPGYHMSKKHWNTVVLDGTIEVPEIYAWIDLSYELVVKGLKKAERMMLGRK